MHTSCLVAFALALSCAQAWREAEAEDCLANEEYQECGNKCEGTCFQPKPRYCAYRGCAKGCHCKPGYYRNDLGNCVLGGDCPATTSKQIIGI